ncbi:MAG: YadA C-terminal domain-containing protein, partial [Neisseria sp.]|nr:YadA C-terminal domain-containing protein [Neisseria sp.]
QNGRQVPAKAVSDRNTYVENVDGELIVKIAENPEFKAISIKNGDNEVNFNTTKPNTLELGGKDGAKVTVGNVAGNLPDTYNKDAVNTGNQDVSKSQELPAGVENKVNNAATVGDVLNAGFNLQANGEAADFVKPYDTVNFADGKNTKVRIDTAPDGKVNTVRVDVDLNPLNNRIGEVDKNARAGIAGANAAIGIPQVYLPGKSMVAAAVGTYSGQNAFAIGFSKISDNGKVILKMQGNANSQRKFGASAGVGYMFD